MKTNDKFRASMRAYVQRSQANALLVVRKLALELLTSLVQKSPVDTGRFRGNWFVQVSVAPKTSPHTDKQGAGTIAAGSKEIGRFELGATIYILNHLPYSLALEHGHSGQAPQGMVMITAAEFKQHLAEAGIGIQL